MALSGSLKTTGYDGRYLVFSWSATQNTAKNQSTISWTLKGAGTGGAGYYMAAPFSVSIAGEEVYKSSTRIKLWVDTVVASGTKTFTHDSEGKKSFKVSVKAAIYAASYNCSGSDTFTLNTIPRAATITSANNFDDEGLTSSTKPTMKWSNPLGNAVTVDVGIFWDENNSLIPYETISGTSGTHTFTLTDAIKNKIYAKLTDSAEKTVYYYIRTTFSDGSRLYNKLAKKVSILNPEPTFEGVIDVDDITKNLTKVGIGDEAITTNKRWIKGYTNILYGFKDINWTKGATEYMCMAINGANKVYGEFKVADDGTPEGVLESVETDITGLYITNSRKYSAAYVVEAEALIEYIDLTCNITNTKMEIITGADGNSTLRATITIEGNLFTGSFNGVDDNTIMLSCGCKADGATEFTEHIVLEEITIDKTKNRYKAITTITGLDYQTEYTFRASAMDAFNAAHINFVYSKEVKDMGKPIFDWSKDDFNFNIPMYYKGQKLIYEAEDSIALESLDINCAGFLSDGNKDIVFTIPINKPIFASGVKIEGSVIFRGVGGYIGSNSGVSLTLNEAGNPTTSGIGKITSRITANGIVVRVEYNAAIANTVNNSPVTVSSTDGLKITFT